MAESSYALKRKGANVLRGPEVMKIRRRCDKCQQLLAGRKGHGFPAPWGSAVECGGCAHVGGAGR